MPVEIRELIVKATVEQPQKTEDKDASKAASGCGDKCELIIAECVAQVMEILKQEKER